MGLFDKLKNVLFEEEEVEIPVITKTDTKLKDTPQEQRVKKTERRLSNQIEENSVPLRREPETINKFRNVKRDIDLDLDFADKEPSVEDTVETPKRVSPFLSFDEDEFERLNSKIRETEKQQIANEAKKEVKKVTQKEIKTPEVPRRFRPSPIISPVYGVLDKNYKKDDIVEKNMVFHLQDEEINVDAVRKKAYGTLEDEIESAFDHEQLPKINERMEYSYEEDARSIDDILKDTIDDSIEVKEEVTQSIPLEEVNGIEEEIVEPIFKEDTAELPTFEEIINEKKSVEEELDEENTEKENELLEKENTLKMLDDIEKELDEAKETNVNLEDTLETDLFNLIDSMYEDEEGEK